MSPFAEAFLALLIVGLLCLIAFVGGCWAGFKIGYYARDEELKGK